MISNTPDALRSLVQQHWVASENGDSKAEHAMYAEDALLDYPQSGERFRGRSTISTQRSRNSAQRHFTVLRITGSEGLWVSECVITYDGVPSHTISIMEFTDAEIVHETQYFADPFAPPADRSQLAEHRTES